MTYLATAIVQSAIHSPPQAKIWLGCSGGRDSMALAHVSLLLYHQQKLLTCPHLIHVNHGMQSLNDIWADHVQNWAQSLDMPCDILAVNLAKHHSTINESTARDARYQAMIELMADGDVLMLAHHANDQAETMLMRLFNGAGVHGLSGIKTWQSKHIHQKTIHLWRPWLGITRQQISDYSVEYQLPYIDDPTNVNGDNTRSWLRKSLLPIITQQYPTAVNSLVRSASLCHDAKQILQEVYQQDLEQCLSFEVSAEPYYSVLNIEAMNRLSVPRQRQLIHQWLQGDEPNASSKQRIDEIICLITRDNNDQQAILDWQGEQYRYSVRRYRNSLYRLREDWLGLLQVIEQQQNIELTKINPTQYYFQFQYDTLQWQVFIDVADTFNNLEVRTLMAQDTFALNAQQRAKSGKKLMQQLAIASWKRRSVIVIEVDQNIVCLMTLDQLWLQDNNNKKLSVDTNMIK